MSLQETARRRRRSQKRKKKKKKKKKKKRKKKEKGTFAIQTEKRPKANASRTKGLRIQQGSRGEVGGRGVHRHVVVREQAACSCRSSHEREREKERKKERKKEKKKE